MSALLPKEYYEPSGRWQVFGPEMFRLKDRGEREFCLGPTHEETDEIIVRLPKPDNSYNYYDSKGNLSGQSVSVTHSSKLAFNPTNGVMTITLQNDLAGRQFMFGNPTMAYIDMAAFLTDNADKLAPKYYTINNSTWSAQNL